ncbi:MAG: hypothetical protein CHACPFDD_03912 [Phycisphaerae bacterium]|nr:hypothetical protein [Phycisphaerae bacterium]
MTHQHTARLAAVANLLAPGAGVILLGHVLSGLSIGLVFAALANLTVCAVLLFPDDFSAAAAATIVALTAASYLAAQAWMDVIHRRQRRQRLLDERREALAAAHERMQAGDYAAALDELRRLEHALEHDILIAYRTAQILTHLGDPSAAAAWRRVRQLDPHHVFRADCPSETPPRDRDG